MEVLINNLRAEENIHILGSQKKKDLLKKMNDAHIFIISSVTAKDGDQEGQGLVLQEAQAMGLPILSTYHNGIPEGVVDKKSGFLVPERDVDALADRLNYLIEHPNTWQDMGKTGREFVEKKYDIKKLNQKLVEIYQRL